MPVIDLSYVKHFLSGRWGPASPARRSFRWLKAYSDPNAKLDDAQHTPKHYLLINGKHLLVDGELENQNSDFEPDYADTDTACDIRKCDGDGWTIITLAEMSAVLPNGRRLNQSSCYVIIQDAMLALKFKLSEPWDYE